MPVLSKGTVIAEVICPMCNGKCSVITNKNGIGYFYCRGRRADGTNCSLHIKWGRADTNDMSRAYLESRKNANAPKPANINAAPAGKIDPPPAGNADAAPAAVTGKPYRNGIFGDE